jgi:hypothetical protein
VLGGKRHRVLSQSVAELKSYAVLMEPLPYPQADRLMYLAARSALGSPMSFSYSDVLDQQRQTRAFESLAAY